MFAGFFRTCLVRKPIRRWAIKRRWCVKRRSAIFIKNVLNNANYLFPSVVNICALAALESEPEAWWIQTWSEMCLWWWETSEVCLRRVKYILFIYLYFVGLCNFTDPQITASPSSSSSSATGKRYVEYQSWTCLVNVAVKTVLVFVDVLMLQAFTDGCVFPSRLNRIEDLLCVWFTSVGMLWRTKIKRLIYTECKCLLLAYLVLNHKKQPGGKLEIN